MRLRTVLVAVLLLALYPATAHAWWWDFFDGLSGPGPFKTVGSTPTFEVIVWLDPSSPASVILDNPAPQGKKLYIALRQSRLNNREHKQMFENQPLDQRHVDLGTRDIALMYRVSPAVDVGAGVSFVRFAGDGFQPQNRVAFLGKMTFTPGGAVLNPSILSTASRGQRTGFWLLRVPKFYVDLTIFKGFEPSDFGNPSGNPLPGVEYIPRAGFFVDVTSLYCAFKGCKLP